MSNKVLVDEDSLNNIGLAIQNKTGSQDTYKPSEMADAISDIPSKNIIPVVAKVSGKFILQNGILKVGSKNEVGKVCDNNGSDISVVSTTMTSFRVCAKIKHNALSDNTKSGIYAPYNNNDGFELDFGRWGSNFFLSGGIKNGSNYVWAEADAQVDLDTTKYYYCVFKYKNNEIGTYIYNEDGSLNCKKEVTISFTPNKTNCNMCIGGAWGNSSMALKGQVDLVECFVEINDTVVWGATNSKTETMGL